jgi:hypothetical protein
VIALFILGYIVAGIFIGRLYNWIEPLEPAEGTLVVLLWPLYGAMLTILFFSVVVAVLVGVRRW